MSSSPLTAVRPMSLDVDAVLPALLEDFAASAAARDAAGGTAKRERDLLRASGLLALTIPLELGGSGASFAAALAVTRRLARVDSSLAHLYAFHHFMLATLQFYGPPRQWVPLLEQTARHRWFWGNTLNPLDRTTLIEPSDKPGEYRISGTKGFCSGASDSDMLIVSALREGQPGLVVAAIPTSRAGILIHDDWDSIGQRQTDSGRVTFDKTRILDSEILRDPGPLGSPFASLRSCLGQLILVELYLGIAEGALDQAVAHFNAHARPWMTSTAATAAEDPYVLRNFAEYWVEVAGAAALTEAAERKFQHAFDLGNAVTESDRGEVAIAVATAKVAASRASLNVSSRIFEVLGARAASARLRLDRFWRNARTHTLHDPLDYKLQELGVWKLAGKYPTPSFYS